MYACVHLIRPSPDSCCRQLPYSTCSQMGRYSVSQEEGWGRCLCTCRYTQTHAILETAFPFWTLNGAIHCYVYILSYSEAINSPEKGVLQVQKVAGLWASLVHLGNNTDVVALSGERKEISLTKALSPLYFIYTNKSGEVGENKHYSAVPHLYTME